MRGAWILARSGRAGWCRAVAVVASVPCRTDRPDTGWRLDYLEIKTKVRRVQKVRSRKCLGVTVHKQFGIIGNYIRYILRNDEQRLETIFVKKSKNILKNINSITLLQ